MISGILASPGIAFGKAFLLKIEDIIIHKKKIDKKYVDIEINKFFYGQKKSIKQLQSIKEHEIKFNTEKESILEGHIVLLQDIEMSKDVIMLIKENLFSAAYAVDSIMQKQIKSLQNINDAYLKERISDIRDISHRLIKNILNMSMNDLNILDNEVILIAKDLTPSETVQLNTKKILGFITDLGSQTSHTAIMARLLDIPAIVGTGNITQIVKNNDYIILDGISNHIHVNPKEKTITTLKQKYKKYILEKKKLIQLSIVPAYTKDNYTIKVCANISTIEDLQKAKNHGAEGIGLYRTEFLFMNRNSLPSEEEQFNTYKQMASNMPNKTIIIRTLDVGGDKNIPYMNLPKEDNPFLGWRAIRITMDRINILHTQLRAILRASIFGQLCIMFPMIISIEEILFLKKELQFLKKQLYYEQKPIQHNIQIGIMIETPAAAIIAHHLIKEIDFFSIGTNDLIQYTLAVDRGNDLISHLYNPIHPALLFLIKNIIDASHSEGKWTGMCGELASNEKFIPILLGMGLDEISMNAASIPKIKNIIRNTNMSDAKILVKNILTSNTMKKINQFIIKYYKK
ncbi:phosphoenolpyruvate-protein phosphotransferase PtsI [Enterobacteriaceae endosymbiont of Macroplea appendiculata]|uniref:phosphoenolpyruvate-protein phosphotransferase PtsI n=1 Tax=Enterobacteriaceae endosymbiont of Macroplea appendiculata TaxID=2675790 RepID=UPI0014493CF8|nr:phosphoenolpyruvate-protein phosphotransferase PtsI [Enterobacteriaceae endosymbiont of Macroplea appendiculata]QJC31002.1 phosphoenolpyruvate-protein phosphotransferase PtsI [Enterobacteriaceae endosymbiont of Macroplea appendiculata]